MNIKEQLERVKQRFDEVNAAMSDPAVFDDPDKYTALTKERSDLEELVQDYNTWKDLVNRQEGNKELIEMDEDPEITEMAETENKEIKEELAIDIEPVTFLKRFSDTAGQLKINVSLFRCTIAKGTLRPRDCRDFKVISILHASRLNLAPVDKKIITYLIKSEMT